MTVDQMEKRITSTLEEYVEIQEKAEVIETLKELPTKECHPFVTYEAVRMCCEKPKHKTCLVSIPALPFPRSSTWRQALARARADARF